MHSCAGVHDFQRIVTHKSQLLDGSSSDQEYCGQETGWMSGFERLLSNENGWMSGFERLLSNDTVSPVDVVERAAEHLDLIVSSTNDDALGIIDNDQSSYHTSEDSFFSSWSSTSIAISCDRFKKDTSDSEIISPVATGRNLLRNAPLNPENIDEGYGKSKSSIKATRLLSISTPDLFHARYNTFTKRPLFVGNQAVDASTSSSQTSSICYVKSSDTFIINRPSSDQSEFSNFQTATSTENNSIFVSLTPLLHSSSTRSMEDSNRVDTPTLIARIESLPFDVSTPVNNGDEINNATDVKHSWQSLSLENLMDEIDREFNLTPAEKDIDGKADGLDDNAHCVGKRIYTDRELYDLEVEILKDYG